MHPHHTFANSFANVQELTLDELESVSGGIIPLVVVAAVIIVAASGCSGPPKYSPPTPTPGGPIPGDPTHIPGIDIPSK